MLKMRAATAPGLKSQRRLVSVPSNRRGMMAGNQASGEELDVYSYALPREELLRNIKRFQARDKYCWSLPIAVIGFALWCLGLAVHADIESSNQIESGWVSAFLSSWLYCGRLSCKISPAPL